MSAIEENSPATARSDRMLIEYIKRKSNFMHVANMELRQYYTNLQQYFLGVNRNRISIGFSRDCYHSVCIQAADGIHDGTNWQRIRIKALFDSILQVSKMQKLNIALFAF